MLGHTAIPFLCRCNTLSSRKSDCTNEKEDLLTFRRHQMVKKVFTLATPIFLYDTDQRSTHVAVRISQNGGQKTRNWVELPFLRQ